MINKAQRFARKFVKEKILGQETIKYRDRPHLATYISASRRLFAIIDYDLMVRVYDTRNLPDIELVEQYELEIPKSIDFDKFDGKYPVKISLGVEGSPEKVKLYLVDSIQLAEDIEQEILDVNK